MNKQEQTLEEATINDLLDSRFYSPVPKQWTAEDDAFLSKWYESSSVRELANSLNRKPQSVSKRLRDLGLRGSLKYKRVGKFSPTAIITKPLPEKEEEKYATNQA